MAIKKSETRRIVHRSVQMYWDTFSELDIAEKMKEALAAVLPEFRDTAHFDVETYSEMYESSTYAGLFLNFNDYETEEERVKREDIEKRLAQEQEARELKDFERLSKKFAEKSKTEGFDEQTKKP